MIKTIAILLLIMTSCQNSVQEKIKSRSISDLSPVETEPIANKQELLHSITLGRDTLTIKMNAIDTSIHYSSLQKYIALNKKKLTSEPLNLIKTNDASHQNVLDVLDLMTIHQIKDFRLLRKD